MDTAELKSILGELTALKDRLSSCINGAGEEPEEMDDAEEESAEEPMPEPKGKGDYGKEPKGKVGIMMALMKKGKK